MKTELQTIAKILTADSFQQPLRNQPDYGAGESILDKLAEQVGTSLETLYRKKEPFPRQAMEFPTEEAMREYLRQHPGADRSKHTFRDELVGTQSGQKDLSLSLDRDNKTVGKIDYSEYAGKPRIKFIEVGEGEKRKGYGTLLLKRLQELYPDQEIDFGMLTEDGSKLVNSLRFEEIPTEYTRDFKKLKEMKERLESLEKKIDSDSNEGKLIKEDWEARDDLDREIYVLENNLQEETPTKKILK